MKVTGPNGNSIFLPAAGYRNGTDVTVFTGNDGYYWSGSLYESGEGDAWNIAFNNNGFFYRDYISRNDGFSVRPVKDLPIAITGNSDEVTQNSAKITCSYKRVPSDAQCGVSVTSSSGTSSLPASIQGSEGSYTFSLENLQADITYTYQAYILYQGKYYYGDKKSFTTATAIDLGLSVKWASYNVGASSPEDDGGYYAWGETEEKSNYDWSTYIHCDGSYSTCHNIGSNICGTQYDVAHVKWGGKWRMPTLAELEEIKEKCTWDWTIQNGVEGMKVTGPNGHSIFLPAADDTGRYWSGSLDESDKGCASWYLQFYVFNHYHIYWYTSYRYYGYQVRPVSE